MRQRVVKTLVDVALFISGMTSFCLTDRQIASSAGGFSSYAELRCAACCVALREIVSLALRSSASESQLGPANPSEFERAQRNKQHSVCRNDASQCGVTVP